MELERNQHLEDVSQESPVKVDPRRTEVTMFDEEAEYLIHDLIRENTRLRAASERAREILRFSDEDWVDCAEEAVRILEEADRGEGF